MGTSFCHKCHGTFSDYEGECKDCPGVPVEIKKAQERFAENERQTLQMGMTAFEYERFVEWLKDPNREKPMFAFTAGVLRTAARAVVESGVLEQDKTKIHGMPYPEQH